MSDKKKAKTVLGVSYAHKYKHESAEDYRKFLNGLNLADLQKESIRVGIVPTSSREGITTKLVKEYKNVTSLHKAANANSDNTTKEAKKPKTTPKGNKTKAQKKKEAALDIMRGAV